MFDELKIKRNEDNTYSMIINGYQDQSGQRFKVEVKRIKSVPVEISGDRESETVMDKLGWKFSIDWRLKINAPIEPDESGKLMQMKKLRKKSIKH